MAEEGGESEGGVGFTSGAAFGKKIGPFAIWQWGALVGGVALVYLYLKRRSPGAAATPQPTGEAPTNFSYDSFGVLNRILELLQAQGTSAGGDQITTTPPAGSGYSQYYTSKDALRLMKWGRPDLGTELMKYIQGLGPLPKGLPSPGTTVKPAQLGGPVSGAVYGSYHG